MVRHIEAKHLELSIQCPLCIDKVFKTRRNLQTHMIKNHAIRKYNR